MANPSATTRKRNFRLDPTIHRIMARRLLARVVTSVLLDAAVLDAPDLGRADGHDRGAGGRPGKEHCGIPVDSGDADVLAEKTRGRGLVYVQVSPFGS